MGIDLATWRARIGLNYYHMCRPLQTRWKSSGGRLYQTGVASWGVGEVMNDTSLVLKGCMTVVALSLIIQYVVHSLPTLKGRGGGGKVRCHWRESTCQVKAKVDGLGTLLLRAIVVVIPLLLVIAGDVETNPGPGEPSLKALLHELHPVRASWYNIGLEMDISYRELDCFKQNYSDQLELMREMLKHWLKSAVDPPPSWEAVVTALRSPLVNEKHVAEKLESKYCASVQHTQEKPNSANEVKKSEVDQTTAVSIEAQLKDQKRQSHSCSTPALESTANSSARHSGSTSPPPIERSQKPPFGCGCGKCTFFSFIERGCPTPIPSASSFPYLDLSGLTHEQQQELRGRLRSESQEIMIRFQKLVSATIESLISQKASPDNLVSRLMTLGAFKPVFKEPQVPLFQFCFEKLEAADTIPKVFLVLKDYFSFFNYHIIEHIIEELGTEEDKTRLQGYKEYFNWYAKRRIFECLPEFGPVCDTDHADIFVKVDSQYDNYTVAEIEVFCHKLNELLRVSSQGILRLCRVVEGCFQLTFQVPSFVQQEIFPLSIEQEQKLEAKGVIELTCEDYHFQVCNNEDSAEKPQRGIDTSVEKLELHDAMKQKIDIERDSFSITTGGKSTIFSENDLRLVELDYELRVQGLVEPVPNSLKLYHASWKGQMETVKFLVEKKHCNPMLKVHRGDTALHVAAYAGHLKVLQYFITERKSHTSKLAKNVFITELVCDLKNKRNNTPLHNAVRKGHLDIVQFFISDLNCDPNIPGQYGRTPLHLAAQYGYLYIVKYLTDEKGCNPSCLDDQKCTPLHCAAKKGHMNIVKFLTVEKHCDPMCRDFKQNTPLHMAVFNCHVDIVKFLTLEMGCDPTSGNANNHTALHLAAVNGHLKVFWFFISDLNCDPNISGGRYDRTPLHYAAECGCLHIVKYLTDEQDCNPSCIDNLKRTPLHCSAMKGHIEIVKFLTVEKHCDAMCRDSNQNTPLHMAAGNGHIDIVKFLTLEMNCDPTSRNAKNDTALHLAVVNGHSNIHQFFISDKKCDPNIQDMGPSTFTGIKRTNFSEDYFGQEQSSIVVSSQDNNMTTPEETSLAAVPVYSLPISDLGSLTNDDHADICVKLDSQYENFTVAEIEGFRHKLSKILHLSLLEILHLCRIDNDCFQLKFQVPSFVKQKIFPLSKDQEKSLAAMGVIRLTCGEYQFLANELPQGGVEKKHQLDIDDCSGMGPSIYTDIKSTTFIEDHLDRELKELDYELKVQGLVETASSHKSGSGLDLYWATAMGKLEDVKFLVEKKHCNPMQRDQYGFSPFHMAAIEGHVQVFKYFITESICNPACPGPLGLTPLHLATQEGHLDIVKYLVTEQQIDPLCEDEYGNTSLHRACAGGCQAVVEFLTSELSKYLPVTELMGDIKNKWNDTPLHSAVVHGHLSILHYFISDHNCDPCLPGQHGRTPLHYCAQYGHLHIVKYLIDERGCDPSCLDEHKYTPLHCATMQGQIDIVMFLTMEKHCDPLCKDLNLNTPLHMAVVRGHKEIVKFLIVEMDCSPTSRNVNNATAVHLAAMNGHLNILKFLISEQQCDLNLPGQSGVTPLHCAAQYGHLHIVKYLIDEQHCNPSCLDKDEYTPLHCAAQEGHMNVVMFLTMEKRCNPRSRNVNKDTALHLAAVNGNLDIIRFFISDQNCNPNIPGGKHGATPLHYSAENGHLNIVKYLIDEQGCDPSCLDRDKYTPLHCAAMQGHLDIVKFLTEEKHCDPNIPGQYDKTALHYAAEFGHLHIVKYLTDEQGCNPSCWDKDRDTPLHYATKEGHIDVVKFLAVERHCNPMCKSLNLNTPLHYAVMSGHLEIVKFFTEELKCPTDITGACNMTTLQMAALTNHPDIAQYLQEHSVIPYIYTATFMMKQLGLLK